MPIHEFGTDHEKIVNEHPLFIPDVWRTVLLCFTDMEAFQIDAIYGRTQVNWLIRERMVGMPSADCWPLATGARSLGLMLYLYQYKIPCTDYDDIIQFCVDKNMLEILLFMACKQFEFYDGNGMPIKSQFCPILDKAVKRNYLTIVQYCIHRFHPKEKFLKKPVPTLNRVMQQNLFDMFKTIVPYITKLLNYHGIEVAIRQGYANIVEYALENLDQTYLGTEIPNSLLTIAAQNGRIKILSILKSKLNGFIPQEAYNAAFSNGHVQICNYIKKRFPNYVPGPTEMNNACLAGHVEIMKTVPGFIHIPDSCFEKAAKSPSLELIGVLKQLRPNYKFKSKLLHLAIQGGISGVCMAVFHAGKYKKIPPNCELELVRKRMRTPLLLFNRFKFPVYNEKSFLEAARICDTDILSDMIKDQKFCASINEKVIAEALGYIYVSSETEAKRGEAYTFIDHHYKKWKAENPNVVPPVTLEPIVEKKKKRKLSISDDDGDSEIPKKKKTKVIDVAPKKSKKAKSK